MPTHPDDSIATAWSEIEARLEDLKAPINAEIRAYPLPIPGCDAQYNHLLERRSEIAHEILRLCRIRAERPSCRNAREDISDFLDSCTLLRDSDKAAIRDIVGGPMCKAD